MTLIRATARALRAAPSPALRTAMSRRTIANTPRLFKSSPNDAATGVDPGYSTTSAPHPPEEPPRPSASSDPFPLHFDPRLEGMSLSSEHQSHGLPAGFDPDEPIPLRVPGRDPGQETREQSIARIIYQTRKRGTLETDLLLSTFAKTELPKMTDEEIQEFDRLLDEPDWDIFYWMTKRKPTPARWTESFDTPGRLGYKLRIHTKNEDKVVRRMPQL